MLHEILYSPLAVSVIVLLGCILAYRAFARPGSLPVRVLTGVVSLAEEHAKTAALQYLIVFCLVAGAFLTALYDVLWSIEPSTWAALGWWQKAALWAKCGATAPAVLVAWLMKSPMEKTPLPAEKGEPTKTT